MNGKRFLFVGLDAADAQLIDQWCHEGLLPNISTIKSQGTSFRMKTTAEIFHVSAWPSIFTGTKPDQHGLYHAFVTHPGHQGLLRPRPDQTPFPFLWKLLSDHGRRSVIMDAFMTCPLRDFNGAQIVDWGSWSWFWEPTTIPVSLKHEIRTKFGPYPSDDHSKVGITPVTDIAGFRDRLLSAITRKTEVIKWLMKKEPWDFFLVVFAESHPAGHYFWHLHDPTYGGHAKDRGELRHALRDVYVALDAALGELLHGLDKRTTVLLVSGDGMGPNYSGSHLVAPMLVRLGALNSSAPDLNDRLPASERAGRQDLLRTLRDFVPLPVRIAVSQALLPRQTQEQLALRWKTAGIAWAQTRAYVIENANEGFIRINLRGREPQGQVAAGQEYEQLCNELYEAATTMVNPTNGARCAHAVYKTDDICEGPFRSHMPDVVIVWNPEARVTTEVLIAKHGLIRTREPSWRVAPFYSGNHSPRAFAAVVGPGIPSGVRLEEKSILDLAPTILDQFGIEPPTYMKGRILNEVRGGTDL